MQSHEVLFSVNVDDSSKAVTNESSDSQSFALQTGSSQETKTKLKFMVGEARKKVAMNLIATLV